MHSLAILKFQIPNSLKDPYIDHSKVMAGSSATYFFFNFGVRGDASLLILDTYQPSGTYLSTIQCYRILMDAFQPGVEDIFSLRRYVVIVDTYQLSCPYSVS